MFPLLLVAIAAIDLAGTWAPKQAGFGPGGNTLLRFQQKDGRFEGVSIGGMMGESPIREVTIIGDDISFVVRTTLGGEEMRMKWSGKIEGEELVLKVQMPAGLGPPPPPGGLGGAGPPGGPREMRFHKLTAEDLAAREAARLKPMPLPARRVLAWNGLAATPPMGWNSYNAFRNTVTDTQIREVADAMVSSGMKAAGYEYVVIDDGWQGERDSRGRLQPNAKFPTMKALAGYVHAKGMKIGLWATPGPRACSPAYAGSYGHEKEDAEQWAEWGMDFIKFDWCSAGEIYSKEQQPLVYQKQAELLRATGRPMLFSICQYGDNKVAEWAAAAGGNMWRTTFDIRDTWQSMSSIGFRQGEVAQYAGAGHWNDLDMLEVGNGGMSNDEYRTHFSLWAMASAPLMAGNDVRKMSPATIDILLNKEIIAIDQDPLGVAGRPIYKKGEQEIWTKTLAGGAIAVAFFNRMDDPTTMKVNWERLKITGDYKVRDLWSRENLPVANGVLQVNVHRHGVVVLRLSK